LNLAHNRPLGRALLPGLITERTAALKVGPFRNEPIFQIAEELCRAGRRVYLSWIDLPIFANGSTPSHWLPVHRRGITRVPGVYFLASVAPQVQVRASERRWWRCGISRGAYRGAAFGSPLTQRTSLPPASRAT